MNRQQRRQLEREKTKQIEKETKEHINKLKKIDPTSIRFKASEWVMSLKEKEQMYLSTMMLENSRHDISTYEECYNIVLENNLDKETVESINKQLLEEGKLVEKYRNDGGDYIMAIKNNSKQIIAEYTKAIKTKDKAIVIEDIAFKYGITENAVKSLVKNIKLEKECTSTTCPFAKNNKCTNEIVTSGKEECRQLDIGECKVTVDKSIIKPKKEIKEEKVSPIYKINNESLKKDTKGAKKMKKSKFKVVSKTVDVQGECGVYHIEGNKVQIENSTYSTKEDVEKDYKATISEIEKTYKELVDKANKLREEKIRNADFSRNETLEIMEEFM